MKNKIYLGLFLTIIGYCSSLHADFRIVYSLHDRYPAFGKHCRAIPQRHVTTYYGPTPYYYADGVFYQRTGVNYVVAPPPCGAVVSLLPPRYSTVVVSGLTFYTANGQYYRAIQSGYEVVESPFRAQAQSPTPIVNAPSPLPMAIKRSEPTSGTITINIPTYRGYIPITLQRSGSGYLGPQGEYYTTFPSVDQLRVIYER